MHFQEYKLLADPQPPCPSGTGIVRIEHTDGPVWYPVCLVDANDAMLNFEYFSDPHHRRVFLYYKDRRKAIGYLWRRYRRGDLEYSRGWHSVAGKQCRLDYCSRGITGNLYQRQTVKVDEAAERLALPKSTILRLIRNKAIPAHLHTHKERHRGRDTFYNYYTLNLAHLEAYIDVHGLGKYYQSMAERQRQLGGTRKLPAVIWCI